MENVTSYLCGIWAFGKGNARRFNHPLSGEADYQLCSAGLPLAESLAYGRLHGGQALAAMTFLQRGQMLKALAKFLLANKERLYALSARTGASRRDGWVDIEGGIGTLFTYASLAGRELPEDTLWLEDDAIPLSKQGQFVARHLLSSRQGVALHINAFNFPCWGMLEKLAPCWLAGMPAIVKPASTSAPLAQGLVRLITDSGLVPEGALQLICGEVGDLLSHLDYQDVVTFTGSAQTGRQLRAHPGLLAKSIPFSMETDSLNCCILGDDVTPKMAEFSLFIDEVVREMTSKAGQKCTAVRRILVPETQLPAVQQALSEALAAVVVGDPALPGVSMGALASHAQREAVQQQVDRLLSSGCEALCGGSLAQLELSEGSNPAGAFYPPTLLLCRDPLHNEAVHGVEAFGPVATLMSYASREQAISLALMGQGSLVATLVTADPALAAQTVRAVACAHGRLLVLDTAAAAESTGHGSPLPQLVHGGPGRAGGGEELGGLRAVKHYMQRTAVQGSPLMLAAVGGQWLRGAPLHTDHRHPFRKHFEELQPGDGVLTARRTITEADIVNFANLSGDRFYAHTDETAAAQSLFGERVAHGYFVVAAAAGLFVDAGVGPVLANYGLEALRFTHPVKIGDTLQAQLTCLSKRRKAPKTDEPPCGVVEWDVQVFNQHQQHVALYRILTLVAQRVPSA